MGSAREAKLPSVVVYKLVEENMESQARAIEESELLDDFNAWEVREDKLKAWLRERIEATFGTHRTDLEYVLHEIEEIDKVQDEIIETLQNHANVIYVINHRSNGLLKFYDVRSRYRNGHVFTPLFGAIRWGGRKLAKRRRTWKVVR